MTESDRRFRDYLEVVSEPWLEFYNSDDDGGSDCPWCHRLVRVEYVCPNTGLCPACRKLERSTRTETTVHRMYSRYSHRARKGEISQETKVNAVNALRGTIRKEKRR